LSFEDIKEIFSNILEFEENAMKIYAEIFQKTTDPDSRRLIEEIMSDEARQANNAKEALKLLE